MRTIGLLLAGMLFIALIAACTSDDGDNDNGSVDATPTSESTDATPTSESMEDATAMPEAFSLPDTTVSASLTTTYKVPDPQGSGPSDDELPVASGAVVARWYQSGGKYVVHYQGLSLAESGPLCPGNSISTDSGFLHISNAPTEAGACTGATTLVPPPTGVKLCGELVLYLTDIPADLAGELFGTIEIYLADGTIIGLTSMATADAAAAPEIDLNSCSDATD